MRVTTASRKRRSWETTSTAPSKPARKSSSHVEAVRVEVVGWLVEEEDVGLLQQRGGEQRSGLLAARELAERPVGGEMVDAEPAADLFGARLGRPRAGRLGALERVGVGVEVGRSLEGGERFARLAESVAQKRRRSCLGRLLWEVADRAAVTRPNRGPARSWPASMRSSVDLPAPLGPTSPARSRGLMVSDSPSKRGAPS